MRSYFNISSNQEILSSHEYCDSQPYLSGNYHVDLLLRSHNWAAGVNTPVTLTYKIVTDQSSDSYHDGFWNNEGKKLALSIDYLRDMLLDKNLYKEVLIDYIEDDGNRDAYQLYENNFPSSFDQIEYMLSIKFENIKASLKAYPVHEELKELTWLANVSTIYDINLDKLNFNDSLEDSTEELFSGNISTASVTKEFFDQKLNLMVKYIFNAMSELANITYQEVTEGEKVSIFARATEAENFKGSYDDYFSLEEFDYSNGKTNHVNLRGVYYVNNEPAFSHMDFAASLHGIGHIVIDHPNDANIAIRENLLPPDNDWSKRDENYGIANEYRSDNACMSVMAFTKCFYQEKILEPISYLPIDIQALQHIYGKNENTRAGDTKYILTGKQTFVGSVDHPLFPMNIPNGSIYSLYDADGINTLDLSLIKEAKIDLNEGAEHFNVIGDNIFLIAYGTHIHNVILDRGNIEIKLNKELSNSVIVPANGAHIRIANFIAGQDQIILENNTNQNIEFSGCIKPYSNIGDNLTEICFV